MKTYFIILFLILLIISNSLTFADFPIRQSSNWDGGSVIAYNSTDHEYLTVWVEAIPVMGGYLQMIKGQRIAENGSMIGSVFTIFTGGTLPSIVYNPNINEYLVVLCKPELCGQRVSSTGTLIGTPVQYNSSAANSQILYNSLAGNYLLIGSETAPANQLFTRKIGADGQPLGAIQNLGMSGGFAAAYAPISSPETPNGRYLLFTGMPYLLDSDGNLLYTITDQHGIKHTGIPFSWGIGEHYAFDVAYGGSTFLVVWADNAHFSQALKDIRCESSGIWGSFIDPYKLDYTSDYVIQDKSFPITRICDHQETNDANGEFIASWKPKATYSSPGQKFIVAWRETPMSFNYNDATVNHIRANTISGAIPPSINTVISFTNGNENPKNPVIAASTINPGALIVWEDSRNSASNNCDLYGNLYSIPSAASITVAKPNGKENWYIGSQYEIKWTCKSFTDPVMIEYSTDGGSSYTSITNSTTNDGSYMWTVPDKPSEYCLIRIKDTNDGDPSDISDAVFTISAPQSIKIIEPNGGEKWLAGSIHEIYWISSNFSGPVKIEYSTNSGSTYNTIVSSTANSQTYNWTVPNTVSSNCKIKVSDAADGIPMDVSDTVFTILNASLKITSPNGGEKWKRGSTQTISWSSQNIPDNDVKIEYSTDNGLNYTYITSFTNNQPSESYSWHLPQISSTHCLIRISLTMQNLLISDISDKEFTINSFANTVSNTNDTGPGSLRQAILDANANPGKDTIVFNIPGTGPFTIQPVTQLPEITDPVVIDGYTQPGSSPNTNPVAFGSNAKIKIELDHGSNKLDMIIGLYISGGNSVVRGIAVNRFWIGIYLGQNGKNIIEGNFLGTDIAGTAKKKMGDGIHVASNSNVIGGITASSRNIISGNSGGIDVSGVMNSIQGNFIGTDITGTNILGNDTGILLSNDSNIVGGLNTEARNIISGNTYRGIQIGTNQSNVKESKILGNFIGTDLNGINALPNECGIFLYDGSSSTTIGGVASGSRNLISGNTKNGIEFYYSSDNNKIEGNLIGTQINGISPLGNGQYGIYTSFAVTNSTIGGLTADAANTIAFNGSHGIFMANLSYLPSQQYTGNRIYGNSIFSNGGLGINLMQGNKDDGVTANDISDGDTGPNKLQNYPVLNKVENDAITTVSGHLNSTPNKKYRIDFYSNSKADPSGYGEGEHYLTYTEATTDKDGNCNFNTSLGTKVPDNYYITATATDPDGNTSEFSNCISTLPNTPSGFKVLSNTGNGTSITFDNVTAGGYTTSTTYTGGLPVPDNLIALPLGSPVYYSINTTADFTGNIKISIQYNDSDLTSQQESLLKLLVYEENEWHDITTSVDKDLNFINGVTTHLSDFIIARPSVTPMKILVTCCQDSGVGSLRHALQLAAESSGPDTIDFNIPFSDPGYNSSTGVWTIRQTGTLYIPEATTVNGMLFFAENRSKLGIEIDGTTLKQSGSTGIWAYSDVTLRGLIVNDFSYGIWIASDNVTVEECYIGTDPSGNLAKSNYYDGILIINGAKNTVIQKNLISGNGGDGIRISKNTGSNIVRNNYIGTNITGTSAIPNNYNGIELHLGTQNNIIENNLISGNKNSGIHLSDSATSRNIIRNNIIGADTSLKLPLPNETFGVSLFNGPFNNIIGPDNYISYNAQDGVLVDGSSGFSGTICNTITCNKITANVLKGINIMRGGNIELAAPIINSFSANSISGKAGPAAIVEFFTDESGEGLVFLGTDTADGSGNFNFQIPDQITLLLNITASATDTAGNTSEFSEPYLITSVETKNTIPDKFILYQNYPNPFNPVTMIKYDLPKEAKVVIRIFNLLGEEVTVLINEEKPAGKYEVEFDSSDLASGAYFYQLEAGDFISTKKFILLK